MNQHHKLIEIIDIREDGYYILIPIDNETNGYDIGITTQNRTTSPSWINMEEEIIDVESIESDATSLLPILELQNPNAQPTLTLEDVPLLVDKSTNYPSPPSTPPHQKFTQISKTDNFGDFLEHIVKTTGKMPNIPEDFPSELKLEKQRVEEELQLLKIDL